VVVFLNNNLALLTAFTVDISFFIPKISSFLLKRSGKWRSPFTKEGGGGLLVARALFEHKKMFSPIR
jgi:hypothetical protein